MQERVYNIDVVDEGTEKGALIKNLITIPKIIRKGIPGKREGHQNRKNI